MAEAELTIEDVKHLAILSRLALSDSELKQYQTELNEVLNMMSILQQAKVGNLPETAQVTGLTNVVRDDETEATLPLNEVLSNAPQQKDGHFIVPDVL